MSMEEEINLISNNQHNPDTSDFLYDQNDDDRHSFFHDNTTNDIIDQLGGVTNIGSAIRQREEQSKIPEFETPANQNLQFQQQQLVIFKFCREVNKIPMREDAFEINVAPRNISGNIATYLREDIIDALEMEDVNTEDRFGLKYYDAVRLSWRDVPQKMDIQFAAPLPPQFYNNQRQNPNQGALMLHHNQNGFQNAMQRLTPVIIELLVKEASQQQQQSQRSNYGIVNSGFGNGMINPQSTQIRRNSLQVRRPGTLGAHTEQVSTFHQDQQRSDNNSPQLIQVQSSNLQQEQQKLQLKVESLEKELTALKEKISTLERSFESVKNNQPLLTTGVSNIQKVPSSISHINGHEELKELPLTAPNSEIQQTNQQAQIDQFQQKAFTHSKLRFICHQCHSEIIKDESIIGLGQQAKQQFQTKQQIRDRSISSLNDKSFGKDEKLSQNANLASSTYRGQNRKASNIEDIDKDKTVPIDDSSYSSQIEEAYEENKLGPNNSGEPSSHIGVDAEDFSSSVSPQRGQLHSTLDSDNGKKKLDMAFLFSDPLMMKNEESKIQAFPQTIDTEGEFNRLRKFLAEHNKDKQFFMKRDAANYITLEQIIQEQPTIIHISCHGDSYFDGQRNIYYLAFESVEQRGFLAKLDEEKLKSLLGSGNNKKHSQKGSKLSKALYSPVKLVFVSACHSEIIGQLFKRVNVPIVIAVNQHSQIGDDVASKFTKHFYDQLLKGNTPSDAFKHANEMVKSSQDEADYMFSCCCAHKHRGDCKWFLYAQKNGQNKGCELHMPDCNCNCPRKWKGYHYTDCGFYKKFHRVLQTGPFAPKPIQLESDLCEDNLPVMTIKSFIRKEVVLCCCKENSPHDESQKFLIVQRAPINEVLESIQANQQIPPEEIQNLIELEDKLIERDRIALDTPLFKSREIKLGATIIVKENMQELNYMPYVIDDLKVIGRNKEVQSILTHLDCDNQNIKTKLIHVYGQDGVGKTAIVRYAAKYALDRRFFPSGVYYVDLTNKNQEHKFLDTLYEKLKLSYSGQSFEENSTMFNSLALSNLIDTIKNSQMLIIIDHCRDMFLECKKYFNEALKKLSSETMYAKVLVISDNKNDLNQQITQLWQQQINEIQKPDAVQLLWTAAKDHKDFLIQYKHPDRLEKHRFFSMMQTFKPSSIISIASLIKEGKTLDQVANEQQEAINRLHQEAAASSQVVRHISSEEIYCWTTNMTFKEVQVKYTQEIRLLYVLCQFPSGLFAKDLDVVTKNNTTFGEWRNFIDAISQEEKQIKDDIINEEEKHQFKRSSSAPKGNYRILTSKLIHEIDEYHYIPLPQFTKYIEVNIFNDTNRSEFFLISLNHLSKLSRKLLRALKLQSKNSIDLTTVSAQIDMGIWSDNYTFKPTDDRDIQQIKKEFPRADIKIKINEANFSTFLDLKLLRQFIPKQDLESIENMSRNSKCPQKATKNQELLQEAYDHMHMISELCINTSSIYIMLDQLHDAGEAIKKAKEIAHYYQFKLLTARLLLIECTRQIKMKAQFRQIAEYTRDAKEIFQNHSFLDGVADAIYLRAISLLSSIEAKQLVTIDRTGTTTMNQDFAEAARHNHSLSRMSSSQFPTQMVSSINQQQQPLHLRKQLSSLSLTQQFSYSQISGSSTPHHQHSSMPNKPSDSSLKEVYDVINWLKSSLEIFQKQKHDFGIGKTSLILSELYVEKFYGTSIELNFDVDYIKGLLEGAIKSFRILEHESLANRALICLAVLKARFNNNLYEAKKDIEEAKSFYISMQDNHNLAKCNDILNDILDQIRMRSKNVFIFAKAFPLVEQIDDKNLKIVGTFTRHINDFRVRVKKGIKDCNKKINMKFDILTEESLAYIKSYGCRVLHLSSDVVKDDCLCIEGENGLIKYLTIDKLKALLKPTDNRPLQVDVVVLAIPDSQKLAQVFVELGVPHVIAFNFKKRLLPESFYMDNIQKLPKRFNLIYDFCVDFYLNLIQEMTIVQALLKARRKTFQENQEDSSSSEDELEAALDRFGSDESDLKLDLSILKNKDGPIILPENRNHRKRLFKRNSGKEKKVIRDGSPEDISKVRCVTNIAQFRPATPFTGRQIETHKVMKFIKSERIRIINVCGLNGLGKTRFVVETAYYMHARLDFCNGIYLVDVTSLKTVEQIKKKMRDIMKIDAGQDINADLQKKDMLLILDNIDNVLKHNKTQFDWFLINLIQQCLKLKIILISKKEIKEKEYPSIMSSIVVRKLKPLNDIESADLILSIVSQARTVSKEELDMDEYSSRSVHQQLQQESRVQMCYGFPRHLEWFAALLSCHQFNSIQVKNQQPNISKSKQEKMKKLQQQPEQISSSVMSKHGGQQQQHHSNHKKHNKQDGVSHGQEKRSKKVLPKSNQCSNNVEENLLNVGKNTDNQASRTPSLSKINETQSQQSLYSKSGPAAAASNFNSGSGEKDHLLLPDSNNVVLGRQRSLDSPETSKLILGKFYMNQHHHHGTLLLEDIIKEETDAESLVESQGKLVQQISGNSKREQSSPEDLHSQPRLRRGSTSTFSKNSDKIAVAAAMVKQSPLRKKDLEEIKVGEKQVQEDAFSLQTKRKGSKTSNDSKRNRLQSSDGGGGCDDEDEEESANKIHSKLCYIQDGQRVCSRIDHDTLFGNKISPFLADHMKNLVPLEEGHHVELHLPDLQRGQSIQSQGEILSEYRSRSGSELYGQYESQTLQAQLNSVNDSEQQSKLNEKLLHLKRNKSKNHKGGVAGHHHHYNIDDVIEVSEYSESNRFSTLGGYGDDAAHILEYEGFDDKPAIDEEEEFEDECCNSEDYGDEFADEPGQCLKNKHLDEDNEDHLTVGLTVGTVKRYLSKQSSMTTSSGGPKSDGLSAQFSAGTERSQALQKMKTKKEEHKAKMQRRQELGPRSDRKKRLFQKKAKNQMRDNRVQAEKEASSAEGKEKRKQEKKIKQIEKKRSQLHKHLDEGRIEETKQEELHEMIEDQIDHVSPALKISQALKKVHSVQMPSLQLHLQSAHSSSQYSQTHKSDETKNQFGSGSHNISKSQQKKTRSRKQSKQEDDL